MKNGMIKHTPQEWADFTGCYCVVDTDGDAVFYKSKPFVDHGSWVVNNEDDYVAGISARLVNYDRDCWGDSLACPPEPPFLVGELVAGLDGWHREWIDCLCPKDYRRPTDEDIKRWFPDREIK